MSNKIAFILLVVACSVAIGFYVVDRKRTSITHIVIKANHVGDTIWEVRPGYKKEYGHFWAKEFKDVQAAIAYKERIDSIAAKNKREKMQDVGFY